MASLKTEKPPYRVPSMEEIRAISLNGLKVVSTFSGCGGSCLGYRMARFKVLWANEFVPIAQESYRANFPETTLDGRDIHSIRPEEILEATGLRAGEVDLFDGSPPCQAFSTAGKREKGWGKEKRYEHGAKQCNESLFEEYIRLLRGLQPRCFVAENVSGLVKGTAKGYFLDILKCLKESGYRVKAAVLDAQWLGVPQTRQRLIFIGMREDLRIDPVFPKPVPYRYSVLDAIPWIGKITQDPQGQFPVQENDGHAPCFAIKAGGSSHIKIEVQNGTRPKKYSPSLSPSPTIMAGRQTEMRILPPSRRVGGYGVTEVDPQFPCSTITIGSPGNDHAVSQGGERRKFTIPELKRICAFPDDFILKGSYSQQWERLGNAVPPVMMYHIGKTVALSLSQ